MITGFRLGEGGASAWSGVRPDLWCFGKVIGGGLPVGAFGGRREVLAMLAPEGPVYQAGTLSGNPLATAAGLAVLGAVDTDSYTGLSERVAGFGAALQSALQAGIPASLPVEVRVPVLGPLLGIFFTPAGEGPPTDFDSAARAVATGLYPAFFRGMLDRGVALAPGPYEVSFTSLAHTDGDLDRTVEAAGQAVAEAVVG